MMKPEGRKFGALRGLPEDQRRARRDEVVEKARTTNAEYDGKLTDAQQERITEVRDEVRRKFFPRRPPERHREQWEQLVLTRLREAVDAGRLKALDFLTPEQKQHLEQHLGGGV